LLAGGEGGGDADAKSETTATAVVDASNLSASSDTGAADGSRPADAMQPDAPSSTGSRCDSSPTQLAPALPQELEAGTGTEAGVNVFVQDAMDVAVNETDVFYTVSYAGSDESYTDVMRVPVRGGSASRVAKLDGYEEFLQLATTDVVIAMSGRIVAIPLDGGAPVTLATTSGDPLQTLAADRANVYFSDAAGTKSVPLAGGSVQTLTGQNGLLALVGSDLIIAQGNQIYSVSTSGGPLSTLATNQSNATMPVGCGSDACWMTFAPGAPAGTIAVPGDGFGTLERLAEGGSPTTVVASWALVNPRRLIFDGTDYYLSKGTNQLELSEILRVPGAGGFPAELEYGPSELGMAVDSECLYWANARLGVFSVAKGSVLDGGSLGADNPAGSGTCMSPEAGPVYCDMSLSCAIGDAASPSCAFEADASPCGGFSCGPGCTCADAQSNACACATP